MWSSVKSNNGGPEEGRGGACGTPSWSSWRWSGCEVADIFVEPVDGAVAILSTGLDGGKPLSSWLFTVALLVGG